MIVEDKAKQLYDKMKFQVEFNSQPSTVKEMSKKLALVCVDQIINASPTFCDWDEELGEETYPSNIPYWYKVKEAITLL